MALLVCWYACPFFVGALVHNLENPETALVCLQGLHFPYRRHVASWMIDLVGVLFSARPYVLAFIRVRCVRVKLRIVLCHK